MSKLIDLNLKTKGILLMSDDVLLKHWNLNSLNTNDYWYPEKPFCKYDLMLSKNVCPHLDSSIRIPNKINCPPKNLSKRSIEEEQNSQMAANFYNLSYYEKECYEKCPLECKKIKYSSDVSILPLSNTFTEYIESLGLLRNYEKLILSNCCDIKFWSIPKTLMKRGIGCVSVDI